MDQSPFVCSRLMQVFRQERFPFRKSPDGRFVVRAPLRTLGSLANP
jgi:hypothetical protein